MERPDERHIAAWRAFLMAQRAVLDRLDDELRRDHDLTLSAYEVLLRLNDAERRRMRMHALASSVLLTPSGLTRLVDRLEAQGLVERASCPDDRRAFEIVLTTAGRARLRRAAPTHLAGIHAHFASHMSGDEADTLTAALGRVNAAAVGEH